MSEPTRRGFEEAAECALEVRDLSFTYAGAEEPVLHNVSWRVPRGSFALLVGDTGSGKSTLLSLAKPQIAPAGEREGEVLVNGRPACGMDVAESARTVGYVFQNPDNQIVCESVWHEMAFGLENLGAPQDEMRRLVAETSYFFGIEDWFRCETDTLSGGRKQLLALASTLVMKPELLLLDEPTAQLDPIAEKTFLHALFRVNRELGCTVVVATHQPRAMLDYATCAFRLRDGSLAPVEDLSELDVRPRFLESVDGCRPGVRAELERAAAIPLNVAAAAPARSSRRRACLAGGFAMGAISAWVLRGIDLVVRPGRDPRAGGWQRLGKSTLLSLLAGTRRLRRRGAVSRFTEAKALLPQDPRRRCLPRRRWTTSLWSGRAVGAMVARTWTICWRTWGLSMRPRCIRTTCREASSSCWRWASSCW